MWDVSANGNFRENFLSDFANFFAKMNFAKGSFSDAEFCNINYAIISQKILQTECEKCEIFVEKNFR